MKHIKQFLAEGLDRGQREMYDGVVDILLRVHDERNRAEIADHVMSTFRSEGVDVDRDKFYSDCGLI